MCTLQHVCGSQRTTWQELLLFFHRVDPSAELRVSASAAGTLTSEQSHLPVWFVTGSHSMAQAALELAM